MSKLTSPVFEYVIPEGLAPGGVFTQNLEMVADTTADYAPFNVLTIDNFSTKTVKVLYGAGHFVYLRGNSMVEIAQNGIRSFSVVNTDPVRGNGRDYCCLCPETCNAGNCTGGDSAENPG